MSLSAHPYLTWLPRTLNRKKSAKVTNGALRLEALKALKAEVGWVWSLTYFLIQRLSVRLLHKHLEDLSQCIGFRASWASGWKPLLRCGLLSTR